MFTLSFSRSMNWQVLMLWYCRWPCIHVIREEVKLPDQKKKKKTHTMQAGLRTSAIHLSISCLRQCLHLLHTGAVYSLAIYITIRKGHSSSSSCSTNNRLCNEVDDDEELRFSMLHAFGLLKKKKKERNLKCVFGKKGIHIEKKQQWVELDNRVILSLYLSCLQ